MRQDIKKNGGINMNKLYIIDQMKLLLMILREEYTDTFYLCFYVILDFGSESRKVYTE